MQTTLIRLLFAVSGLYDFIIGFVFLVLGPQLFDAAKIPHPNHWAFVQFGALLLVIFGTMFLTIAYQPFANRNLIPFGMLLKVSYCGLAAYWWASTDIPWLFKPFAVIDAVMLIAFIWAYFALRGPAAPLAAGGK